MLISMDRMVTFLVENPKNNVHCVEIDGRNSFEPAMYECDAFEFDTIFHVRKQCNEFSSHFITNMKKKTDNRSILWLL